MLEAIQIQEQHSHLGVFAISGHNRLAESIFQQQPVR
jgi:hypothetical protein